MILAAADQRSLICVPANLTWSPIDGDGLAATISGTVTVTVQRADGTVLVTAAATTGSSPYTYALAVAYTALTDILTAVWLVDGVERARTTIELVGGYIASIPDIRAADPTLGSEGTYPNADLIRARDEVTHAFSMITGGDFTPHYHYERLRGTGTRTIELGWGPLRTVRSVVVTYAPGQSTTWTAAQCASVPPSDTALATLTNAFLWPADALITIGYESGLPAAPKDVRDQFFIEVRKQLNDNKSPVAAGQQAYDFNGDPIPNAATIQTARLFSTLNRYMVKVPGIG